MVDNAGALRDAIDEHTEWYSRADLRTAPQQERDEARRMHAEAGELLDSLYTLHACEKDGWSSQTVVVSDIVGELEDAIDNHAREVSRAESELELRVEEGVYAIKLRDTLDRLDQHLEALRLEAEQRPALRCGRDRPLPRRRGAVPLI